MKKYLVIAMLLSISSAQAAQVLQQPLDFALRGVQLRSGQIAYGWKLMPWQEWLQRPSSGPLLIETIFNKNDIEVFEARAAAIVMKPSTFFTEQYLHNINTIKKLNPQNEHKLVPDPKFRVETIMPFPTNWADMIAFGKRTKLLDDKTTGYIRMESIFAFASRKNIEGSPELQRIIKLLDISGIAVEAINIQGTLKVNQIADFISVVTTFHKIDEKRTLVVSYVAVTLKKHLLNKGVNQGGLKLNGRSILLGENSALNKESGIGAGLPKYFLEFYAQMIQGFEN